MKLLMEGLGVRAARAEMWDRWDEWDGWEGEPHRRLWDR